MSLPKISWYSAAELERLVELAEAEPGLQLAGRAAGGGHQAAGVLGQDLLVHPRPLDQEAFGVGPGGQLEQVVQAFPVPGPDGLVQVRAAGRDVVLFLVRLAPQDALGVGPVLRGDVGLDADHRGDAGLRGLAVKLGGAVHVAVVGHRDMGHALARDLLEQFLEAGGAVQHRVFGVHVEVREGLAASVLSLAVLSLAGLTGRGFRHGLSRLLRARFAKPVSAGDPARAMRARVIVTEQFRGEGDACRTRAREA